MAFTINSRHLRPINFQLCCSSVSCGENHSVAVSKTGQLFSFGDGRHGKLCLDLETLTNHFTPVLVSR